MATPWACQEPPRTLPTCSWQSSTARAQTPLDRCRTATRDCCTTSCPCAADAARGGRVSTCHLRGDGSQEIDTKSGSYAQTQRMAWSPQRGGRGGVCRSKSPDRKQRKLRVPILSSWAPVGWCLCTTMPTGNIGWGVVGSPFLELDMNKQRRMTDEAAAQ